MPRTRTLALVAVAFIAAACKASDDSGADPDGVQDDGGASEGADDGESAEPGFADCASMAEAAVCLGGVDEECILPVHDDVVSGAVCKAACQVDSDCPPAPPGGDPVVQCRPTAKVASELRCKLSCAGGRECPDGMFCHDGLDECLWEREGCPYLACDPIDDCPGDGSSPRACRPFDVNEAGAFQCGGAADEEVYGREQCAYNGQCNALQLCRIDENDSQCGGPGCCVQECRTTADCRVSGTECVEYFDPDVVPDNCLGQVGVCLYAEPHEGTTGG